MKVKIKKLHPDAVVSKYSKRGDAGLDLTVTEIAEYNEYFETKFGIAIEIPEGYVGLMFPRSSITTTNLILKNSVGVIDSGFRGQLLARFKRVEFEDGTGNTVYKIGDRAAQLIIMPIPYIDLEEVEELSETDRGEGGFGSTN